MVSDNDPQFTGKDIKWFLQELHIEHYFTSIKDAKTNRQVDAVNKVVTEGFKRGSTLVKEVGQISDHYIYGK